MKTRLTILGMLTAYNAGLVLLMLFTGCLLPTQPQTVQDTLPLFEAAAYTGTVLRLDKKPDSRQTFEQVRDKLEAIAAAPPGTYPTGGVVDLLNLAPFGDETGGVVAKGVVLILWEQYIVKFAPLPADEPAFVKPVAGAVAKGIRAGLVAVPPK